MSKIIACGNEITDIYYSGYTIERVYACGGQLVYGEAPVIEDWKLKLDFSDGRTAYLPCDSTSAITESEVKRSHVVRENGTTHVEPYSAITAITVGDCVKTIDSGAFSGMTNIEKVYSYGLNVEIIKTSAFQGCSGITTIYIPCSTTTIQSYAFSGCTSVTGFNICAGVETIGNFTFANLTSLSGTVSIPATITSIGRYAFFGMVNVTRFNVNPTVPPTMPNSSMAFNATSSTVTASLYVKKLNDYKLATGWREYVNNMYQL